MGLNVGPLVMHSDAYLTEFTWKVLTEGCLTSLLEHQSTFLLPTL